MQLRHGIFDEASISVSTCRHRAPRLDDSQGGVWTCSDFGRMLWFVYCNPFPSRRTSGWAVCSRSATGDDAPAITVTMRDLRCPVVNLDPDSASPAPEVMTAIVRANQNNAGIYGAVTRIGRLAVGQTIFLRAPNKKMECA
jgi:uncharacterized protein